MIDKLTEILSEIQKHEEDNPSHGTNCACMDKYIRELRQLTIAVSERVQRRVDYVIRTALNRYR